jgi:hypothetical protein
MRDERTIAEFLAKAAEAERMASAIIDCDLKDSWLAIARQYRSLAETALERRKGETTAQQRSPLQQSKAER